MYLSAIEDQEYKDEKIGFWDDVYGFNYSCIKDIALREPLVDTVDIKSVVCDPYPIKQLDLLTVTKEELAFECDFTLNATRDDYVHAFLGWFDISFDACHKPVQFSTGPHSRYTHWKQTVFYTKDVLALNQGDAVSGKLVCKPNERNNRDLDITIDYTVTAPPPHQAAWSTRCPSRIPLITIIHLYIHTHTLHLHRIEIVAVRQKLVGILH